MAKSDEKLAIAKKLFGVGAFDDCVSRAYYSAFHAATAVLLSEGLTADTHSGLISLFGLHFIKSGRLDKKLGKYLSNLKEGRENSDYEVFSSIDQEEAETALKETEEFIKEMKIFLKNIGCKCS